jgi:hypothetical protein
MGHDLALNTLALIPRRMGMTRKGNKANKRIHSSLSKRIYMAVMVLYNKRRYLETPLDTGKVIYEYSTSLQAMETYHHI